MRQRRHQPVGIEDGTATQHEIDGAGQFDGQDGVGFEFITQPGFQPLGQRTQQGVIALPSYSSNILTDA